MARTTFRRLTRSDEPFLWTALYHAIHVAPGEDAPPPGVVRRPDLARYVAGWTERPGDLGLLACDDGRRIGAAWLRQWPAGDHGYGFVGETTPELSMALLPGHRGRGVGTRLLRHLLSVAAEQFDAVSLSVSETNPARRLYEREGFVPAGHPAGGSTTMVKRLAR